MIKKTQNSILRDSSRARYRAGRAHAGAGLVLARKCSLALRATLSAESTCIKVNKAKSRQKMRLLFESGPSQSCKSTLYPCLLTRRIDRSVAPIGGYLRLLAVILKRK